MNTNPINSFFKQNSIPKKFQMNYFFVLLLTAFFTTTYGQTIINDKNAEIRNVGDFWGIKVSGGIDVYLSQSSENALAISASTQKMKDDIDTRIVNGILVISYNSKSYSMKGKRNLRAYISFKNLQSLEGNGACTFNIQETLKSNAFKINLSGACELKGKMDVKDMDAKLSGASTVKASGKVTNLKLEASGASDMKNFDLQVENFIADLSGASDVKILISNSITVKASGASSLNYSGNPEKVTVHTSGASSVTQRK